MKLFITILVAITSFQTHAQGFPIYSIASVNNYYTITCTVKQISLSVVTSYTGPLTYTWTGPSYTAQGAAVTLTAAGNYTLAMTSGTTSTYAVIPISSDTVIPICSPASMTLSSAGTITLAAISPTVNITHYIYDPYIPTPMTSTAVTVIFNPSSGTYSHCLVNNTNGCNSCSSIPVFNPSTGSRPVLLQNKLPIYKCYPNPTNGGFKITPPDSDIVDVEVFDSMGNEVKVSYTLAPELSVDAGNLPAGMYVVVLIRKNRTRSTLQMLRL